MSEQVFNTNPVQQTTNPAPAPVAQPAPVVAAPVTPDPTSVYEDLVARVTNPDGTRKYATVSDALNAMPHAQKKIAEQQAELARLQAELEQRGSIEAQLQQMREQVQPVAQPVETPQPSEQDLAELVAKQIEKIEGKKAAETNTEQVRNKLSAAFGEKAGEVYAAKAAELGVATSFLDDMAAKSPQALFKMLGVDGSTPAPQSLSVPTSTQATTLDHVPQTNAPDKPFHKWSTAQKVDLWKEIKAEVNARHLGQS